MARLCLRRLLFMAAIAVISALQPRESESRQKKDLGGMWNFRADYSPSRVQGFDQKWYAAPLSQSGEVIPMPVPSSYNDITTEARLRDFVGWVWYDREFYVSTEWLANQRVVLRFGSAHYNTIVYLNGDEVMSHSGGHLPFETEVTSKLLKGVPNRVTVAVNNTLTPTTLPPGTITYKNDTNRYPPGYFVQNLQMDFFNYAGIHRPVWLYTTPKVFVQDILIKTSITNSSAGLTGQVMYRVELNGTLDRLRIPSAISVSILDADRVVVENMTAVSGVFKISKPRLWWPYTISNKPYAYLYQLEVMITASDGSVDVYREPFGIRTVTVTNTQLFINNQPFYCKGVAKHEDSDLRGKGVDLPLIARDFNLLKWLGVDCFRTSHYPYAEEIMDEADRQGIAVIDESPGVGIKYNNFGNISLAHHVEVMGELVRRDKNRPSVIMWSVANEPESQNPKADHYFKTVIEATRSLDDTRPVTFVIGPGKFSNDQAAQYVDIICVNHYYAWYSDMGHLEVIGLQLKYDLDNWHKIFKKPVILTEYGADTVPGLHSLPSSSFTEDYQVDFLRAYHQVLDLIKKDYLVGEMVWNFADFMTIQGTTRVQGNKKGLFTRQRQPKPAAHIIKDRYQNLLNNLG